MLSLSSLGETVKGKIKLLFFQPHREAPLQSEASRDSDEEDESNEEVSHKSKDEVSRESKKEVSRESQGEEPDDDTTLSTVRPPKAYLSLQLQIYAALELSNVHSKGSISSCSNPFCIVKVNSTEVYRTAVIANTLNPHWHNEIIEIRIPKLFDVMKSQIEIELWHSSNPRKSKRSKFLGCVNLTAKDYCNLSGCDVIDAISVQEETCALMEAYYEKDGIPDVLIHTARSNISRRASLRNQLSSEPLSNPLGSNDDVVQVDSQKIISQDNKLQLTRQSTRPAIARSSSMENMNIPQKNVVKVDIFDKGLPKWIDLQHSVHRTAAENSIVQGKLKVCCNFKLPPPRELAIRPLPNGLKSSFKGVVEVISSYSTSEMKRNPVIVVSILSLQGAIYQEALKFKNTTPEFLPPNPQKSSGTSGDMTFPPELFCVLRDSSGEVIGKTMCLDQQFSLRWKEEKFWIPFPSKGYQHFPVLFTIEIYCRNEWNQILSLGTLSFSAQQILETLSDPNFVLGETGGIGTFGEFKPAIAIRCFEIESSQINDDLVPQNHLPLALEEKSSDKVIENHKENDTTAALIPYNRLSSKRNSSLKRQSSKMQLASQQSISQSNSSKAVMNEESSVYGFLELKIEGRNPLDFNHHKFLQKTESIDDSEVHGDDDINEDVNDDEIQSIHSECGDEGQLTLTLCSLSGMGLDPSEKKSIFGKKVTKVYCQVWINGFYYGQTSTIKLTTEASWNESFIYHLPENTSLDNCHIEIEIFKQTACKISSSNPYGVATYSAGTVEISSDEIVKLCNSHTGGDNGGDGADDVPEVTHAIVPSLRTFSIDTKPNLITGLLGIKCTFQPRIPLERLAFISPDQQDEHMDRELEYTPAKLILNIYEAANLANADLFGRSDPFVIIIWNGVEYGRTYIIQDTLNPVWIDQIFILPIPRYKDVLDCQLELHVYDDQTIGQNQFLGCVSLSGLLLKKLLSSDPTTTTATEIPSHWYDLKPSKNLSKKQNKLVQGSLRISGQYTASHRLLRRWSVDHLKINFYIFNAENLSNIEITRKPNVFCVIKWKGHELGRTSVIRKALNPKWNAINDTTCQFTMYYPDNLLDELQLYELEILLYHSDLCKETELLKNCLCLGRCVLSGDIFLKILVSQQSNEITPMSLALTSFTKESVECRIDTFNKIIPQGRVDVGILVNNSENIKNSTLQSLASTTDIGGAGGGGGGVFDCTTNTLIRGKTFDSLGGDDMSHTMTTPTPPTNNSTLELGNTFNTFLSSQELSTQQLQVQLHGHGQGQEEKESSYKMYFDTTSGSYYYLNELTGDSSWDKPLDGKVSLYHTPEQLQNIQNNYNQQIINKEKKLNEIRNIVEIIRNEHNENKKKLEFELKQKHDHQIHLIWQKALLIASKEENECNISWQSCNGIDKILYNYENLFSKKLRILRLVGIGLHELPSEFCINLSSLELLSLANNYLKFLPETIYHMTNLHTLDVRNNLLISLPSKIGLMSINLLRIELSNNKLLLLPNTISSLILLKKIDLENNLLKRLPENLHLLYNLEILNINSNQLITLPRCIKYMKKLKILSCNKNCISYIPNELCGNTSVECLRLCTNQIQTLPENIGQMKQLRELWLDHNNLTYLPGSICYLKSLQLLKLENNKLLQSPGYDIIGQGAQAIVKWSQKRYIEEGYWRRKHIIITIQDCLQQITDMNTSTSSGNSSTTSLSTTSILLDNSQFESCYQWNNSKWYALDMEYFWSYILPELNKKWKRIIDTYDHIPNNMTLSFPYTRKDVMWALTTFQDAYGPIYMINYGNFRRCSCRNELTGKRQVCIPPCKGFMCRKKCSLIKHDIVLQHEKELRLWKIHKKYTIDDSVKRAEKEALKFLQSNEGKLWITQMAYERAEEILNLKGLSYTYEWRDQLAEKKKSLIIEKYNKKKLLIEKNRDKKATKILLEINELKNKNKLTIDGGYNKESIQQSLQQLYNELSTLPENEILKELNEKCEIECNNIDDDLIYTDTSEEEEGGYKRETYLEKKYRLHQEAEKEALNEVYGATVPNLPQLEETPIKDFIYSALDKIPPKDRREVLYRRNKRRFKRLLRNTFDIVMTRLTKLQYILNGEFHEIQQELEHETYVQYISNAGAIARRKAEREFYVLGRIRSQWKGLGLEAAFKGWKKYVKQRVHRQHADIRQQWRLEKKQYESDLIAIHLAQAQLSLWEKFTDVYSDKPYWKNWQSQDVTWEEPKLEDYLPEGCNIPKIPMVLPPNVPEDTSESEVDEDYRPRVRTGLMIDENDSDTESKKLKQSSKEINVLKIENKDHEGDDEGGGGDEDEDDEESQSQLSNTDSLPSISNLRLQDDHHHSIENSSTSLQLIPSARESIQSLTLRDNSYSSGGGVLVPTTSMESKSSTHLSKSSHHNPNDFTKQEWLPLIPRASTVSSLEKTISPPQTNQYGVTLPNIHSARSLTTYHPNASQQQQIIHPSYSYGPDSLRAGKLPGRVGRPLFLENIPKLEDDGNENKWNIMTSDAEKLLGQYDPEPNQRKHLTLSANADLEKQRALEGVKMRREQGKTRRHHTYMKQRNRRPRVHEELVEERKKREAVEKSFEEPTPEELLTMLNSNPNELWRSDQIKLRTELASKAIKLQKRIKDRAVKEGLIEEKKQGFLKTALLPLLNENYNPEEEEEEGDDKSPGGEKKKKSVK